MTYVIVICIVVVFVGLVAALAGDAESNERQHHDDGYGG